MPFFINNIDVTVASNAIYGLTSASIYNVNDFGMLFAKSSELREIYLNTTRFVGWAIENNFTARPDLAQV